MMMRERPSFYAIVALWFILAFSTLYFIFIGILPEDVDNTCVAINSEMRELTNSHTQLHDQLLQRPESKNSSTAFTLQELLKYDYPHPSQEFSLSSPIPSE